MEVPKERPVKAKKREPNIIRELPTTSSVDANEIERLVKRLENLEVISNNEKAIESNIQPLVYDATASISDQLTSIYSENETQQIRDQENAVVETVEGSVCIESNVDLANDAESETVPSVVENGVIASTDAPEITIAESAPTIEEVASTSNAPMLYPAIDRLRLLEETAKQEPVQHRPLRIRESAPPMSLSPELLTEMQLRSFYYNAELEQADDFVDEFLESTLRPVPNDEFFALLQSYLDSCRKTEQLQVEVQDRSQRWDSAYRNVWLMENGKCGEGHLASGTYTVPRAKFQENCYQELKSLAQRRRQLSVIHLPFASHQAKTAELQCKHYVYSLLQEFRNLTGISAVSPVFVRFDSPAPEISVVKSRIWNCVSVLFYFLRQSLAESAFKHSCRSWLNDLIGNSLRYSFVDDHLFFLSHVLRCPNGVGVWASGYVQPVCQLSSGVDKEQAVDHFLTMLSICLNPIRRREDYLKSFLSPDVANSWTIVDVDGEENRELEAISEADLLCLLKQFSFDQLFSTWFGHLQESELTETRILRLFAFELTVLRILFDGIRTYNVMQYKQICKNLAYVMRQSVQYVAEFWVYFKSLQTDVSLCERLQLEFDRLAFYTVSYGVVSKGLGVWQFLADLPYGDVSVQFQWRLLDLLLSPSSSTKSPRDLLEKPMETIQEELKDFKLLELRLYDLDQTDATYLLTALSNMACSSNDVALVRTLTALLFMACFERPSTRENHHKVGRDLISAIAERHIWIISHLLEMTKARLDHLGGYALELFDHLPISLWQFGEGDWSVLKSWLYQPLASLSNVLAQRILQTCNWGFVPESNTLFLAPHLHEEVADAIVKAYGDLCPVQAGVIAGSIKKASKMASGVSGQLSEQQFVDFCFSLVLRLKLHPFDIDIGDGIRGFESETGRADLLARMEGGNPLAAFVLFQLHVRSIDSLLQLGLKILERLSSSYVGKPTVVCMIYSLRLLSSGTTQIDESFQRCFDALVHMDDSYYQYAKTFIAGNVAGENVSNFGSALSETILRLTTKRQSDASNFVNFTVRTGISTNPKSCFNDRSTLYLLDRIIEASFLNDPSMKDIVDIFRITYERTILPEHKYTKGGMLSLFRSEKPPPALLAWTYFRDFPWLAYVALKSEETCFEKYYQTLKMETLRHPGFTLENCIKNANSKCNAHFTFDRLAPFLYLELACVLDADHPLLPLVAQECCLVVFQRLRSAEDTSLPISCAGGIYMRNVTFSSKMDILKKSLQSVISSEKIPASDSRKELFGAIITWLSDLRLWSSNQAGLTSGLPLGYVLESIFNGTRIPWLEYVDIGSVRSSVEKRAQDWSKNRRGLHSNRTIPTRQPTQVSPLRRLFERTKNADSENLTPAPVIGTIDPVIFTPDVNLLQDFGQVLGIIHPLLDNFYAAANDFNNMQKSVLSLDETFLEQLKKLYSDVNVQVAVSLRCQRSCPSPNNTKVMTKISKSVDNIQHTLDQNRMTWSGAIDNICALLSYSIPHHCVCLYAIVRQLVHAYSEKYSDDIRNRLTKTGVEFFQKLVSTMNECISEFPPTKALFHASVEALGVAFILHNPTEIEKLLNLMKEKKSLFHVLINLFDPECASNESFLRIYRILIDWVQNRSMEPSLIVECFKKINFPNALRRFSAADIVQLNRLALLGCKEAKTDCVLLNLLREHWTDSFLAGLPINFRSCLDYLLTDCANRTAPVVLLDDIHNVLNAAHHNRTVSLGPAVYIEIVTYLAQFFKNERTRCKQCLDFGIFHCWESYAHKLWPFLSFCYLRSLLNPEVYSDPSEGIACCFASLETLYGPWIMGVHVGTEVHPPWSLSVSSLADAFVQSFVDCLCGAQRLYADQLEASTVVCTLVLEFYVGKIEPYADKLGNYILRTYQTQFLRLNWHKFRPTITCMEMMLEVLKNSHSASFVTSIVVRLPWMELFHSFVSMPIIVRRASSDLLLNIVVRCASKESNYVDCKASFPGLIQSVSNIDWSALDANAVANVCSWILLNYDSRSILHIADEGSVDGGLLRLLATVSYITTPEAIDKTESPDSIMQKRIHYIRLFVALLDRFRCMRQADVTTSSISESFVGLIYRIDSLARFGGNTCNGQEILQLLCEALLFWNQANMQLFDTSLDMVSRYLADNPNSVISLLMMEAYGNVATNGVNWVRLRLNWLSVAERCIAAYFSGTLSTPTWNEVVGHLVYNESWSTFVKAECQANGKFLVFHAFCMKRLRARKELSEETVLLRDVIETLKLLNERQLPEAPVVVLIGFSLNLLVRQVQFGANTTSVIVLLRELVSCLQNAAEGRSGILSTLGLAKKISYTPRFQLLATVIANYCIQQIVDDDRLRLTGAAVISNSRIQWAKSLRTNKQYSSFPGAIDAANDYFADLSMHFSDTVKLYVTIAPILFTETFVSDQCLSFR